MPRVAGSLQRYFSCEVPDIPASRRRTLYLFCQYFGCIGLAALFYWRVQRERLVWQQPDKLMTELAATIVITSGSVALFVYWYRYAYKLLLGARTSRYYAAEVAASHQLSFPEVWAELRQYGSADLGQLQAALDRDFARLVHLLPRAADAQDGLEERMLRLNYLILGTWCRLSRRLAPTAARHALTEMCEVLAHCANAMGARAAAVA